MKTSTAALQTPKAAKVFMLSVVVVGTTLCFGAAYNLSSARLDWFFYVLACVTIFFGSRLEVKIPRSEVYFMMGDAIIFLTFLRYGGETAILLAAAEAVSTSLRIRKQFLLSPNLTVCFNGATMACATAAAYSVSLVHSILSGESTSHSGFTNFFTLLAMMAFVQFCVNTFLAAWGAALKTKNQKNQMTAWQAWKKYTLTSSLTIFAGAATAGFVYRIIEYSNFLALAVAVPVIGVIYWACRHFMGEMRSSYEKTEQAERERAQAEQRRAEDAVANFQALQESHENFRQAVLFDKLTGLPNRTQFSEALREMLIHNQNEYKHIFAVLLIDLERFKTVNASLGYAIGDQLLINVGKRLINNVRDEDRAIVARLEADKFGIILNGTSDEQAVVRFAERIQAALAEPFGFDGRQVITNCRIGIVIGDQHYQQPEDVLRDVTIAMHHAKEREQVSEIFNPALLERAAAFLNIEMELRRAIENEELRVFYQPIIDLKTGRLRGFEALMRWQHPTRGLLDPGKFIRAAEESRLIVPMTYWILRRSCEQTVRWQAETTADLFISVNLSGHHFAQPDLVAQVKQILAETRLASSSLKLEITESIVVRDTEKGSQILEELRKLGCQISIDDFGTEYSSLSYLHKLPLDTLKIDRSFVAEIDKPDGKPGIVKTIIALAENLELNVIAEGIETIEQLEYLRSRGCFLAQGYLFAKPLPLAEMDALVSHKINWLPETSEAHQLPSDSALYYMDEENRVQEVLQLETNLPC